MNRSLDNNTVAGTLNVQTMGADTLTVPNAFKADSTGTQFYFNTLTVPFVAATTLSVSAALTLPVYTKAGKPTGVVGQLICISDDGGKLAYWTGSAWNYVDGNTAVPAS